MKAYPIYFRFRNKDRSAHVHEHDTFAAVYFTDSEILQDFGGRIEYDQNKKVVAPRAGKDALTFYKTVEDQLK